MPTLNSWGNQVLAANVTLNGGTCNIGSDATSGAINIGTGAAARTTTIGNGTGATSIVLDCGTGPLNLGTNAIARTTTLGNTTGASVLALKYGTGYFTLASATGTVMSALDTGEITYPLQSAFLANLSATTGNVTGTGTIYTIVFDTELFDQNSDYNNGTGTFTAPVTGIYSFYTSVSVPNCTVAFEIGVSIVTTAKTYSTVLQRAASTQNWNASVSTLAKMTAADTAIVRVYITGEAGDTDKVYGNAVPTTRFSGQLVC